MVKALKNGSASALVLDRSIVEYLAGGRCAHASRGGKWMQLCPGSGRAQASPALTGGSCCATYVAVTGAGE